VKREKGKRQKDEKGRRNGEKAGKGKAVSQHFRSFEELTVWKLGRQLRHRVYQVSEGWPKREQYGLAGQIRSAAVAVTANIAEGYGRYHYQENIQLCRISRGSVNEVLDHLHTALDEGYVSQEVFDGLYAQGREVERVLNGYINYLKREMDKARGQKVEERKREPVEKEQGERAEREGVLREAVPVFQGPADDLEWEGRVQWVYDCETGFDAGWAI
jgi:four helix bundle protein